MCALCSLSTHTEIGMIPAFYCINKPMQCPVFVLATDEGHSAVTEMFGKKRILFGLVYIEKSYSMISPCMHHFIKSHSMASSV